MCGVGWGVWFVAVAKANSGGLNRVKWCIKILNQGRASGARTGAGEAFHGTERDANERERGADGTEKDRNDEKSTKREDTQRSGRMLNETGRNAVVNHRSGRALNGAGGHSTEREDTQRSGRADGLYATCLLYTSPSPRDRTRSRMPSSA